MNITYENSHILDVKSKRDKETNSGKQQNENYQILELKIEVRGIKPHWTWKQTTVNYIQYHAYKSSEVI